MDGVLSRIRIRSEITSPTDKADPEITEEQAYGSLTVADGSVTVSYKTRDADGTEVRNLITALGARVTVEKDAGVSTCLVFEEGVSHAAVYSVGPYAFDVKVSARKIRNGIGADGGRLDLYYDMIFGGDVRSVVMRIEVTPKNKARRGL